ncbi:MAG: hypothetical protein WD556_11465 [Actinomycetota bacterium]
MEGKPPEREGRRAQISWAAIEVPELLWDAASLTLIGVVYSVVVTVGGVLVTLLPWPFYLLYAAVALGCGALILTRWKGRAIKLAHRMVRTNERP